MSCSRRSLLSLEDVCQHGARGGELTHLAQELGLGIFTHQTGGDGGGAMGKGKKGMQVESGHDEATS